MLSNLLVLQSIKTLILNTKSRVEMDKSGKSRRIWCRFESGHLKKLSKFFPFYDRPIFAKKNLPGPFPTPARQQHSSRQHSWNTEATSRRFLSSVLTASARHWLAVCRENATLVIKLCPIDFRQEIVVGARLFSPLRHVSPRG